MATGIVSWSQPAATNATADSNVNWAEGQAPSSVNDSARAMMASVRKWLDDNNGSLAVGGGTTNYTVTSNQVFPSLSAMHRQTLRLLWPTTCAASPTLNVDGLGAKQIVSTVGTNIGAGGLAANGVYDFCYENNNAVWILCSSALLTFPVGTIMLFNQTAAPTGWTKLTSTDDAALRLVSGTVTAGGLTAFSTAFAAGRKITQANLPNWTLSHTLTVGIIDSGHTHGMQGTVNRVNATGSSGNNVVMSNVVAGQDTNNFTSIATATPSSNTTGITASISGGSITSGGSDTGLDFGVKFVDVIAASKA